MQGVPRNSLLSLKYPDSFMEVYSAAGSGTTEQT